MLSSALESVQEKKKKLDPWNVLKKNWIEKVLSSWGWRM